MSDKEYPSLVAFRLLSKISTDFEDYYGGEWKHASKDLTTEPDFLKADIVTYQKPEEADKLTKIQKQYNV